MLETRREFRLDSVPQQVHEPLAVLVEQLTAALPGNLDSVTVVGSALTSDFHPKVSDINTVAVVQRDDMAALRAVGSLGKTLRKKRLSAPLLMTPSYIARSRDVFGVELLDFQLTHRTILGDDLLAELTFAKRDVRLQCERELKATLSRFRQGYITSGGHKGLVQDLSLAAVKGLAPLLRAMLWLKDIERPATMEVTFRKSSEAFGVDLTHAIAIRQRHYGNAGEVDIELSFESIYTTVDKLATMIDMLEIA
jgi:hypothetical protein